MTEDKLGMKFWGHLEFNAVRVEWIGCAYVIQRGPLFKLLCSYCISQILPFSRQRAYGGTFSRRMSGRTTRAMVRIK